MDDSEFLQNIREGHVQCYRTLNLRTRNNWADLAHRELAFFVGSVRCSACLRFKKRTRMTSIGTTISAQPAGCFTLRGRRSRAGPSPRRSASCLTIGNRCMAVMAWVGADKDSANELWALVFSGSEVLGRRGKAELDNDWYWYARFTGPWAAEPGCENSATRF